MVHRVTKSQTRLKRLSMHTHAEVIKELCGTAIILYFFPKSSFCLLFAIQQMLSTFCIQGILLSPNTNTQKQIGM